jgi:hypothetical protein
LLGEPAADAVAVCVGQQVVEPPRVLWVNC